MILLRLTQAGLVFREQENGVFIYTLTAKGHARRTYLVERTGAGTE